MLTRLSPRDESDLLWFFSRGQISFERSTMGSMLERSELFSVQHYPEQRRVYDAAGRCIGFESGITARPTAELRAPGGYVPDDDVLTRYAHVSAVLKRVERASPLAARVFESFYGDLGERWALLSDDYGRLGALFHLTDKGRELLRAEVEQRRRALEASKTARKRRKAASAQLHVTQVERMENLVHQCTAAGRREVLARCCVQARELEREARTVWSHVRMADKSWAN